jgi:hypothetical protein
MEGKVIDLCPGCSSMWFDSGELAGTSRLSIPEHKLRGRASSVGPRQCPGCGREMNVLEAHPGSDIRSAGASSWTAGSTIG